MNEHLCPESGGYPGAEPAERPKVPRTPGASVPARTPPADASRYTLTFDEGAIIVNGEIVGEVITGYDNGRWWAKNVDMGMHGCPTIITKVHFTSAIDAARDLVAMLNALGRLS